MKKELVYDVEVLKICKWDFEKATKLQNQKKYFTCDEWEILINSIQTSNELAMGIVDEFKLNKILNHVNKNKKQYMTLACLSFFLIANGAISFAMPTTAITCMASKTTTIASALPNFSMGAATGKLNVLINNLIKLGILGTVASCTFEMLKNIVEGSINRMPKTLITHSMMCCSLLLTPTVFNYISGIFNMGKIITLL